MKTTFIYALNDPVTGRTRYIGKTNNLKKRFWTHCKGVQNPETHKDHWISGLLKRGLFPLLEVVDEVSIADEFPVEAAYIQFFREEGFDLTNTRDGGSGGGQVGRKRSKEYCERVRAWMQGNKNSEGFRHSKEFCENISVRMTGIKRSAETREKISKATSLENLSEETLCKKRVAAQNRRMTPESNAKRSATLKGRKPSLATIEASRKAHTGVPHTEEHRAKLRAAWVIRKARDYKCA